MLARSGRGNEAHSWGTVLQETGRWPVCVCLFGSFQVLVSGRPVTLRSGGKAEALLTRLALGQEYGVAREALLEACWPGIDPALAGQSLKSLVYTLHKLLGDALDGASPVVYAGGHCRLNVEAGLTVDVFRFEDLLADGDRLTRAGDDFAAAAAYHEAVLVYRGDLCVGTDLQMILYREDMRARYLTALAQLADYSFVGGRYEACLDYALQLLASEPCREDAHRLVMRCPDAAWPARPGASSVPVV